LGKPQTKKTPGEPGAFFGLDADPVGEGVTEAARKLHNLQSLA
jgi:hypothetical protein